MHGRLQLLTESIQQELPRGFESGFKEHEYGGVDFFVFDHGREVVRASYDLDQLEDYTDKELVQFVLRDFRKSARDH